MNDKMPWKIRARVKWEGDTSTLNYLRMSTDLGDFFYTESTRIYFDLSGTLETTDYSAATQQAMDVVTGVNGRIQGRSIPGRFQFVVIERYETGRAPTQVLTIKGIEGTAFGVATISTLDAHGNSVPPHRKAEFSIILSSPDLAYANRLLADICDNDWGAVYKIGELLTKNMHAQLNNWGLKGGLKKLNAAANNPGITGDHCRHAVADGNQAKAGITFTEAKDLVTSGVEHWINHLLELQSS